jgi:hypothetical protein
MPVPIVIAFAYIMKLSTSILELSTGYPQARHSYPQATASYPQAAEHEMFVPVRTLSAKMRWNVRIFENT